MCISSATNMLTKAHLLVIISSNKINLHLNETKTNNTYKKVKIILLKIISKALKRGT